MAPDQPLQVPLASLPIGAMPGSRMQSSLVAPGQRSWKVCDQVLGGRVGLLRRAAGPRLAVHHVLGDQQDRPEGLDL